MTCTRCYDDIRATRPQANLAYANAPDFCQSKHCHKSPRHLLTWSATVIDSINRLLASTRGQHPSTWFPSALSAHPLIDTMSTHGSQAGPSSSGSGRAPRGSACLNCRRRKLVCNCLSLTRSIVLTRSLYNRDATEKNLYVDSVFAPAGKWIANTLTVPREVQL